MVTGRRIVLVLAGATCLVFVAALTGCGESGAAAARSSCLRSHGWKVEQLSKGFFVATRGQEELGYGSSGPPEYGGTAESTNPSLKLGQLRFACFPKFVVSVRSSGRYSGTVTLSSSPSG